MKYIPINKPKSKPFFKFKKYWQYYTVLIIVLTYALVLIGITYPITEQSIEKSGMLGDSFGILTALFSGLAFAGIIISIKMQSKELKLTRKEIKLQHEELSLTRNEVKGQKKELKFQNRTLKKQAFENTFFQMLDVHTSIVKDLSIGDNNYQGRAIFGKFSSEVANTKVKIPALTDIQQITEVYSKFYNSRKSQIAFYFSNLYYLLEYVNSSSVKNKSFYTNIVRAQLSEHELKFICYHGISSFCEKGFKSLIEKYCILKNFTAKNEQFLKLSYHESAFSEKK